MDPIAKWLFGLVIAGMLGLAGRVAHNSLHVAVMANDISYIKRSVGRIESILVPGAK